MSHSAASGSALRPFASPERSSPAPHPALARRVGRGDRAVRWSGEIASDGGRHRASAPPDDDPLADTDATGGLHKFDLGMVPASVTPPRSSRRAAWFAVVASGAALGGLLLVMANVVGPSESIDGMQLPGMPRFRGYPELQQDRPSPFASLPAKAALPPSDFVPRPHSVPLPRRQHRHEPPAPAALPATAPPVAPPVGETGPVPAPAESQPPETRFRNELLTLADPQLVAARSGEYFAAISSGDLRSAYAMTTGSLRSDGYEAFAARYADAESVEVLAVTAASSGTVTDLRITRPDGSVHEQQRRLRFTSGGDPQMFADEAAG